APILYTQAGVMAAIVPYSVAGKSTTQMQYEYRGMRSNTVTVKVASTHPGLFTVDASGQGAGAIRDAAYNVVTADNPARKGNYILLSSSPPRRRPGHVRRPAARTQCIGHGQNWRRGLQSGLLGWCSRTCCRRRSTQRAGRPGRRSGPATRADF